MAASMVKGDTTKGLISNELKKPLVSVIIPSYNYEEWIGGAIQSCLNQTYKNLEIIVVDDGSTDNSIAIIKDYYRQNPEIIKYCTKPNRGHSSARNVGVEMARGDYFLFLDADDLLLSEALESFVKVIQEQNVDAAVGDWINFYEDSGRESYTSSKFFFPDDPLASLIEQPMVESAIMVKRTSQKWNENLKVNEIEEYFFTLFAEGYSIGYVGKAVTKKRQHQKNGRVSIKYDHFYPVGRLNFLSPYKKRLKMRGMLTFYREMALDQKILWYIYAAKMRRIKNCESYLKHLNILSFTKYFWYKPFGLSGFVYHLGPQIGLNVFYSVNKVLGRV